MRNLFAFQNIPLQAHIDELLHISRVATTLSPSDSLRIVLIEELCSRLNGPVRVKTLKDSQGLKQVLRKHGLTLDEEWWARVVGAGFEFHLNSAKNCSDPAVAQASKCLGILPDSQVSKQLGLVGVTVEMRSVDPEVLPRVLTLLKTEEDFLKFLKKTVVGEETLNQTSVKALSKIAGILNVSGLLDRGERVTDNKVLSFLADRALARNDLRLAADLCLAMVDQAIPEGWEMCYNLVLTAAGSHPALVGEGERKELLKFAAVHANRELIEPIAERLLRSRSNRRRESKFVDEFDLGSSWKVNGKELVGLREFSLPMLEGRLREKHLALLTICQLVQILAKLDQSALQSYLGEDKEETKKAKTPEKDEKPKAKSKVKAKEKQKSKTPENEERPKTKENPVKKEVIGAPKASEVRDEDLGGDEDNNAWDDESDPELGSDDPDDESNKPCDGFGQEESILADQTAAETTLNVSHQQWDAARSGEDDGQKLTLAEEFVRNCEMAVPQALNTLSFVLSRRNK